MFVFCQLVRFLCAELHTGMHTGFYLVNLVETKNSPEGRSSFRGVPEGNIVVVSVLNDVEQPSVVLHTRVGLVCG